MAVVEALKTNYTEMATSTKISFFAGVSLILLIFIFGMYFLFEEKYGVLFSDLESQDASSVISELEKNKIHYKLEDGGRKILVSDDRIYETRLKVANNVPTLNGGVGFEIFDKDDFGTTEFAQKINFQRALQGELARTIMALNEVRMARVHLVLPESSLFKRKESNGSASVIMILREGKKLSKQQVTGIQRLVASSTPGLKSKNVTILNQKGVTLISDEQDENNVAATSKKLERKREVEEYLTNKAQNVLDKTFGRRIAHVTIDVSIDFTNIKTTREQVISPNTQGANISRKKEVRMKNNKKKKTDTSRSTVEIDYELSKKVEQIVSTPGSINRMSIAVVVPPDLNESEKDYIKKVVGNAVGYDVARGDMIALSNVIGMGMPKKKTNQTSLVGNMLIEQSDNMLLNEEISQYDNKTLNWIAQNMQFLVKKVYSSPLITSLLVGLIALYLIYLLVKSIVVRPMMKLSTSSNEISDEEKKQLLSDIKNWLATESK